METLQELWDLVHSIPRGKVGTYGALGAALKHPASGFMVGRWIAQCPEGVPWWRVVAKNGSFPIEKRDPYLEMDQRRLLQSEGVTLVDDRVEMDSHFWEP
jgi:methylated-DNA-protein-cysteine methyltransferase-like protein